MKVRLKQDYIDDQKTQMLGLDGDITISSDDWVECELDYTDRYNVIWYKLVEPKNEREADLQFSFDEMLMVGFIK